MTVEFDRTDFENNTRRIWIHISPEHKADYDLFMKKFLAIKNMINKWETLDETSRFYCLKGNEETDLKFSNLVSKLESELSVFNIDFETYTYRQAKNKYLFFKGRQLKEADFNEFHRLSFIMGRLFKKLAHFFTKAEGAKKLNFIYTYTKTYLKNRHIEERNKEGESYKYFPVSNQSLFILSFVLYLIDLKETNKKDFLTVFNSGISEQCFEKIEIGGVDKKLLEIAFVFNSVYTELEWIQLLYSFVFNLETVTKGDLLRVYFLRMVGFMDENKEREVLNIFPLYHEFYQELKQTFKDDFYTEDVISERFNRDWFYYGPFNKEEKNAIFSEKIGNYKENKKIKDKLLNFLQSLINEKEEKLLPKMRSLSPILEILLRNQ